LGFLELWWGEMLMLGFGRVKWRLALTNRVITIYRLSTNQLKRPYTEAKEDKNSKK
jgi:hypothetical protein